MQNLGYFRDFAEWNLKVYLSMEAESVIGVSNSRDLAWLGEQQGLHVHMI